VSGSRAAGGSAALAFGPFRLSPQRRLLLEGDKVCRIGSRSMDILLALLERAGETVTKQELLDRAWSGMDVEEVNLRVHVAALRKALGDGQASARYIVNVMGRGYCFVAPVRQTDEPAPPPAAAPHTHARHNLPTLLTRVVGRGDAVEAIALQVPMRRCVTITGPGGIGKTTVAIAAAEKLVPVFDDGVWVADLATVQDRQIIPFTIASALGFAVTTASPLPSMVAFLQAKRLLLVLENCEHIVDAVAPLVEAILQHAPNVRVLATSREALRTSGEWIYRLKPLATPAEAMLTAEEAMRSAAVQLFVERTSACLDGFSLGDADAPIVAEICRRLDGLPLAIELAAARIDMYGLRGLASVLDEQCLLLSSGHRTAQPRQQSLLGALDWSYRLLSADEQIILQRLAVFRRDFTLEAAIAIVVGEGITVEQVYAGILTLSTKSLITTDVTAEAPQHYHRLLYVTRSFVAQKLRESGEHNTIARRHADYLCRLLRQAAADWEELERKQWLEIYARLIDDVRAALDWAFSPTGDVAIGTVLSAACLALSFQLSLIDELRTWVQRALLHVSLVTPPQILPEMRLNIAMASLGQNMAAPVAGGAFGLERAVELARQLDDPVFQAEPLIGQTVQHIRAGDYRGAAALARQACAITEASGDARAALGASRMAAQAYHHNCDHAAAHRVATFVLEHPIKRVPLSYNPLPVNRRVSMRVVLARIAWMQGFPERAAAIAREAVDFAGGDSAFSVPQSLAIGAIPIALWSGDNARAEEMVAELTERASRYSLAYWQSWAAAFHALLRLRAGMATDAPRLTDAMQFDTFTTFSTDLLIPATILRADNGEAGWCQAELHRAQGEWLLAHGAPGATDAAEALFLCALEVARRQQALGWELRAATSLARLWQRRDRVPQGRALLSGVLQRFTEGFRTADVSEAAGVLASLAPTDVPARPATRRRTATRSR
jgi:predicted ATPase/DNA-binding winged helix-turn-helix (wHTH) protein